MTDKEFPATFESIVKKILKLLYHVLAHIYHSHFKEIVLLSLHSHLNCIFAHFVLFNDKFKLIEDKEIEVLHDLAIALRLFPPVVTTGDQSGEPLTALTPTMDSLGTETSAHFAINSAIIDNNNGVITTQCRSISPLVEANKCLKFVDNESNTINKINQNNNDSRVALSALQVPFNPTAEPHGNQRPDPLQPMADASSSQSTMSEMKSGSSGRRSISASAILSSSDPSIPITISRRCNSDRSAGSGRSPVSALYHRFDHHNRASIVAINTSQPLFAACGSSPFKFQ